jgi:hypothetical protein
MKRLMLLLALLSLLGPPVVAQRTLVVSPDVPTDDPGGSGTTFLPWEAVAYNNPNYLNLPVLSLPLTTQIDALHKMDRRSPVAGGAVWLISVEVPTELPMGSGAWFQPEDVFVYDGATFTMRFDGSFAGVPVGVNLDALFLLGDDSGDLIVSFDVPVDLPTPTGIMTFEPADLIRFAGGFFVPYFDASASGAGVATTSNAIGADHCDGVDVISFDVPTDLLPSAVLPPIFIPGHIPAWDPIGMNYLSFEKLVLWPITSGVDALTCQANPGRVYEKSVYPFPIKFSKPSPFVGPITISWAPSCSSGAEQYGIYEGSLISLRAGIYDHKQLTCFDAGLDLKETVTPTNVDSYFLVVPYNLSEEGAYGIDRDWTRPPPIEIERPQPVAVGDRCVPPQSLTPCP